MQMSSTEQGRSGQLGLISDTMARMRAMMMRRAKVFTPALDRRGRLQYRPPAFPRRISDCA